MNKELELVFMRAAGITLAEDWLGRMTMAINKDEVIDGMDPIKMINILDSISTILYPTDDEYCKQAITIVKWLRDQYDLIDQHKDLLAVVEVKLEVL